MSPLQNYSCSCSVFNAMNQCVRRDVLRSLLSGVVALMFCHTALALDINQANEAELDSIKGMGPALSAKVLKARSLGAFKDWSDLMQRVSGIRQNKAQQLSEQGLTVNGQTFATKP
ncbi:helix-hairpin-helix domain-containing protein [Limnohabitans sp. Jir61]|jgi:competence protein ComEA|uniref:ComEA family DNA-binding protein n=1 Tax=Limnohabitans sp. Jir61 TaxID=1826168 RepID=UPI001E461534|nr:helix-hairpin-helix domain-containing protein [Limnohabitans sp. Jir61]